MAKAQSPILVHRDAGTAEPPGWMRMLTGDDGAMLQQQAR